MDAPHDIARRQIRIFSTIGHMAEEGELVGDLVRRTTRRCLTLLFAAGFEPAEARSVFTVLLQELASGVAPERTKMLKVFDSAIAHAEFLTLIEENQVDRSSSGRIGP